DQRPGQTVREVVRLLCRGAPGAPPDEQGEIAGVLIPVEKLEPGPGFLTKEAGRWRPGTPSGFSQAQQVGSDGQDRGMALNDYLLGRLELPQGEALYEARRVRLRRPEERTVELFEMYW